MKNEQLLFVYNADSTVFATTTDFVKKILMPEKYDCNLCLVTYGTLKMQNPWKEYLDTLKPDKVFLHRDEFALKYPKIQVKLPAVFLLSEPESDLKLIITGEEINAAKNIQQMITLFDSKESITSV